MDVGKSFSFPFEDKEWITKLGLGAVIALVPILNFAWSGYMVGIIRNVMDDVTEPLPAWDDLGRKFTDGLILFGAGLVYALPMIVLLCLPLGAVAFSGMLSGNTDMQDMARIIGEAGGVLFYCLLCVFVIYGIALSIIYPAILVMFAREGTFAACFKLREVFALIGRNAPAFFTAWGLSLLAGFGIGLATGLVSWIPCLGWILGIILPLVVGVYTAAIYAHLFGQFGMAAFEQRPLAPVM